jgi:hypothetical protein
MRADQLDGGGTCQQGVQIEADANNAGLQPRTDGVFDVPAPKPAVCCGLSAEVRYLHSDTRKTYITAAQVESYHRLHGKPTLLQSTRSFIGRNRNRSGLKT